MNQTEELIKRTFQGYESAKIASLTFLYPAMRVAGMLRGTMPCFVQTAKAPFDVGGFYHDKAGTVIGLEIKETAEHETSLSIVHPEKKGNGLQYHQLAALVKVHEAGGTALLLWNNGGEVGVMRGDMLLVTKLTYDTALKVEGAKRTPAKGSKSILWGHFSTVTEGHDGFPLWLPPSPAKKGAKGA